MSDNEEKKSDDAERAGPAPQQSASERTPAWGWQLDIYAFGTEQLDTEEARECSV